MSPLRLVTPGLFLLVAVAAMAAAMAYGLESLYAVAIGALFLAYFVYQRARDAERKEVLEGKPTRVACADCGVKPGTEEVSYPMSKRVELLCKDCLNERRRLGVIINNRSGEWFDMEEYLTSAERRGDDGD